MRKTMTALLLKQNTNDKTIRYNEENCILDYGPRGRQPGSHRPGAAPIPA